MQTSCVLEIQTVNPFRCNGTRFSTPRDRASPSTILADLQDLLDVGKIFVVVIVAWHKASFETRTVLLRDSWVERPSDYQLRCSRILVVDERYIWYVFGCSDEFGPMCSKHVVVTIKLKGSTLSFLVLRLFIWVRASEVLQVWLGYKQVVLAQREPLTIIASQSNEQTGTSSDS